MNGKSLLIASAVAMMFVTGAVTAARRSELLLPHLGYGVGLRTVHYPQVVDGTARADWFEVIYENFMIAGGRPLQILDKARELAPVVCTAYRSISAEPILSDRTI